VAELLNAAVFLIAQDEPGRGDDPGGGVGVVIIVAIVLVVLAAGIFLARKVFVRGTMPTTPQQDREDPGDAAPPEALQERRRAQE
jgi:hypothetical protein